MTSGRTTAFSHAIELALAEGVLTVGQVSDDLPDISESTCRRAVKDAESTGWLEKRSKYSHTWERGELAREYINGYEATEYPSEEPPFMYYAISDFGQSDFLDGENVLASAGVAWNYGGPGFSGSLPNANHLIVDSGGYQAAVHYQNEYPYSAKQLHQWAEDIEADAVFGMDWACEDASVLSANTGGAVAEDAIKSWKWRLKKSFTDQQRQYKHYKKKDYSHYFRPVVQGQKPQHFKKFAEKLKESEMPTEYVGIGTVCKRSDTETILDVVDAVHSVLPSSKIHLFGATLNVWKNDSFDGVFYSSDTAAWMQHDPRSGMYADSERRAHANYKQKVSKTVVAQD